MIGIPRRYILPAVGALVLAAGTFGAYHTLQAHRGFAAQPGGAAAGAPAAHQRVVPTGQAVRPTRSTQAVTATRPASVRILRVAAPRPGRGVHMAFPRTWRPMTLEVHAPAEPAPARVLCLTCPPGATPPADQ